MSAINQPTQQTRYQKKVTNYSEKIFQGVVYQSVEDAVLAGAKHHAKMDWKTIETINELNKTKITPQMLLDAKVKLIEDSMAKHESIPEVFK